MAMLRIDTEYLKEEAGIIETSEGNIDGMISNLQSAKRIMVLFSLSADQKAINNAIDSIITELEKLKGGLEEVRVALIDGATQIEEDVGVYEPALQRLTDDIRMANGYTPSGSSFGTSTSGSGSGSGSASTSSSSSDSSSSSNTTPVISTTGIPTSLDPIPGVMPTTPTNEQVAQFFQNIISFVNEWLKRIFNF